MEKAIVNLKTNKVSGEDDITTEFIENGSRELKERLHVLICKMWRDEKMPDDWKVGLISNCLRKAIK